MKKYKYPINRLRGILHYWKGQKMSDIGRKNISESHKGKIPSNLELLHHSPKIKNKRIKSLIKYWDNPSRRIEFGKNRIGEKNPAWKNDARKFQEKIRRLYQYTEWKKRIFEKEGIVYDLKLIKKEKLQVHHLKTFNTILLENNIKTVKQAINCRELWDINNGIILRKGEHYLISLLERQKNLSMGFILWLENFINQLEYILKEKQKELKKD